MQKFAAHLLRRSCDPAQFSFETTKDVEPVVGTIGQNRAVQSLDFGLEVTTTGYNLYVAGLPGTGRETTVRAFLTKLAKEMPRPDDWCYVHNFRDAYRPLSLRFPAGRGRGFATDMQELVDQSKRGISQAFQSESFTQKHQAILDAMDRKREQLHSEVNQIAQAQGMSIEFGPDGVLAVPIKDGKPMTQREYEKLTEDERDDIKKRSAAIEEPMRKFVYRIKELEDDTNKKLRRVEKDTASFAVSHFVDGLKEKYRDLAPVVSYLEAVFKDIVDNLHHFARSREEEQSSAASLSRELAGLIGSDPFARYRANVIVDNQDLEGAPVIFEHNPTYYNLVGRINYQPAFGALTTDFRLIKAGALHRANGGFLVLQIRDVLLEPYCWDALKRALDAKEIAIENMAEMQSLFPTLTVRPMPIPLDVKVILIGNPQIYTALYQRDEDFRKLFKVRADFDVEMPYSKETIDIYAGFVRSRVEADQLQHFDRTGVAKIVEFGSRLVEHQEKLSTQFLDIADIISEASFVAKNDKSELVSAKHVQKAIAQKEYRSGLLRDKIHEAIEEELIQLIVEGSVVGQLNAISLIDIADLIFGKPIRLTAQVSAGDQGIIAIERAVELSDPFHSKGVLILNGYLAGQYTNQRISLNASLTFEQSYAFVYGDSASAAELFAILSAISEIPVRQDLAVTGSVNQKGEVQAVGGVQYKIEGFFDVCKAKGLTGTQGVIIPETCVKHLMLREDVIDEINNGKFHIYGISTIDEGIELLTKKRPGKRKSDGSFPKGTFHFEVAQRLAKLSKPPRRRRNA